jgi:hypothetical protein
MFAVDRQQIWSNPSAGYGRFADPQHTYEISRSQELW